MNRETAFLVFLFAAACCPAFSDDIGAEQINRIIKDGNANGIQSLDAATRAKLNAALLVSGSAIDAVQNIGAEQRNKLKSVFPVASASSLLTSLISYWNLNETSGVRADSVVATGNNLTDNNTVTSTTGVQGNAAYFTLANQESLSHANNASLQMGNIDYTISCWANLHTKTANRFIFSKRGSTSVEYEANYKSSTDRFVANFGTVGNNTVTANNLGSPSLDTWYFISVSHNATLHTLSIQVNNGTADTITESETPATDTGVFYIGEIEVAPTIGWDGAIDEFGIWKRTLTAAENTTLYKSGGGVTYPTFAFNPQGRMMVLVNGGSFEKQWKTFLRTNLNEDHNLILAN
jgi:hypothetical protein